MKIRIAKSLAVCTYLAVTALGISSAPAHAEEIAVTLSGAEETPPVATQASGKAKFTVSADRSISGKLETSGVDAIAVRIHLGAPGQEGPAIITLVKQGKDTWIVPRNAALTEDRYASFKAGNLYVTVETAEHKSGEIRGQIKR